MGVLQDQCRGFRAVSPCPSWCPAPGVRSSSAQRSWPPAWHCLRAPVGILEAVLQRGVRVGAEGTVTAPSPGTHPLFPSPIQAPSCRCRGGDAQPLLLHPPHSAHQFLLNPAKIRVCRAAVPQPQPPVPPHWAAHGSPAPLPENEIGRGGRETKPGSAALPSPRLINPSPQRAKYWWEEHKKGEVLLLFNPGRCRRAGAVRWLLGTAMGSPCGVTSWGHLLGTATGWP